MTFTELFAALTAVFPAERLRQNESLAAHTTMRVGGPADIWLAVESAAELAQAATLARRTETPLFMLGSGANILVSEAGIRGLVIENRAARVQFLSENRVLAESGTMLPGLARRCAKHSLSGLEWAVGVPGTVGGAVVNNAGAYGGDMAQLINRVELLSAQGERVWQSAAWLEYNYRTSRLKRLPQRGGWVVLQAEFQMSALSAAEVETVMTDYNRRRKASQPPGATSGSMFKNPPGDYAGRLIEAAGLKGYRVGQAQISTIHANFFVNLGGARAIDMLDLIDTAQTTVQQKFGMNLELEIELVGCK
jgi:UDP-N-acetylmuramate dehydrogenase